MTAKVLSIAAALGLLIGSSTLGVAQNAGPAQASGPKPPEKVLMDPKADAANDAPGRLVQETGEGGTAAYATAQGTTGAVGTTGSGEHH